MQTRFLVIFTLLCFLFSALSSMGAEELHKIEVEKKTWLVPESILVRVFDENKQPVPGAKVTFALWGHHAEPENTGSDRQETQTDDSGNATFALNPEFNGKIFDSCTIQVARKGLLLPERKDWSSRTAPSEPKITVPDKVDFTLKQGKIVRFQIVDENKNAIPGVEAEKWPFSREPASLTDSEGYWEYDLILESSIQYRQIHALFRHPDFETLEYRSEQSRNFPPDPIIVRLKRGDEIPGTLKDEQGNPVADAAIFVCGDSYNTKREFQSDADGRFHLKGLNHSPQLIIISKKGMVEKALQVDRKDLGKALDLTMQTGKTLRIKFEADSPQIARSFELVPPQHVFGNFQYRPPTHSPSPNTTDVMIEWNEAPDEEIEYYFTRCSGSEGAFRSEHSSYKLRPREEPYIVKLVEIPPQPKTEQEIDPADIPWSLRGDEWKLPEKLQVAVVNSFKEPIEDAKVRLHLDFGDVIEKTFPTDAKGIVEFDLSSIDNRRVNRVFITVSAEGHLTEEQKWYSDPIRGNRKRGEPLPERLKYTLRYRELTHEILRRMVEQSAVEEQEKKLLAPPVRTLSGKLVDPEGNPVPDAYVKLPNSKKNENVSGFTTDRAGKFSFLLAQQDTGTTEIRFHKSGFSPLQETLDLTKDTKNLQFTMPLGKSMKLRFVDENGNGVSGVSGNVLAPGPKMNRYRGEREILENFYGVQSNSQGNLILPNAPDKEMEYTFDAVRNWATEKNSYLLKPTSEVQTIKMRKLPMMQRRSGSGKSFSFGWNNGYIQYQE